MSIFATDFVQPTGPAPRAPGHCAVSQTPALTSVDRLLIHDILRACDESAPAADQLVGTILRRKLTHADTIDATETEGVATANSRVSYMVTGGGATTGVLRHSQTPGADDPHAIPISSLLGATLIGMKVRQRASLPRADGSVLTLALLKVEDDPEALSPGPAAASRRT